MVLIHRGKGFVVLIAGVVAALGMNFITNAFFHTDREYYENHTWPKLGTLWLAGLLCIGAGAYLRKRPTKVKGADRFEGESADHFFFIPVIYWGGVFFALGVIYLFAVYWPTSGK